MDGFSILTVGWDIHPLAKFWSSDGFPSWTRLIKDDAVLIHSQREDTIKKVYTVNYSEDVVNFIGPDIISSVYKSE